jgi:hypothetical protein
MVLLQLFEAALKYITENKNLIVVTYFPTVLAFFMPIAKVMADFLMGLLTYFLTLTYATRSIPVDDLDLLPRHQIFT